MTKDSISRTVRSLFPGPAQQAVPPLEGSAGNDVLWGTTLDDVIRGHDGNDILIGDAGDDYLDGGAGNDTVIFTSPHGLRVFLSTAEGQDTGEGFDSLVNIENVVGGAGSDFIKGNAVDNVLNGGAGADTLQGGYGNDTYIVDTVHDKVYEQPNQGYDSVLTSSSFTLDVDIEALIAIAGSGSLRLTGNGASNRIVGAHGNDTLNGGGGGDTLEGGSGDDVYVIGDQRDVIVELAQSGMDTAYVTASAFFLSPEASIETIIASGRASVTLKGSDQPNSIHGTVGADHLLGAGGNDRLYGGLGKDILEGGRGRDIFVFNTDLHKFKNVDRLPDYNVRDDSIWLENGIFRKLGKKGTETKPAKLKKAFFTIGTGAKDKNDYILYNKKTGALSYDSDGVGGKSAIKIAVLKKGLKLTHKDFFVI